jgi:heme oxygenase (biliverdin-IX-beta and delta-forming)
MKEPAKLTMTMELRAKTAQVHEALDSGLHHAFGSVDQYVAFLRASHRILSNLDQPLARLAERPTTERHQHIGDDLQALGQPRPDRESESGSDTWQPTDVAEAMGCAYVVQGSSLGGLVLAKLVQDKLGITGEATSYLRGHGPRTKDTWREFMAQLDAWGENALPAERQAAARGALTAFAAYSQCFADEGLLEERSG